MIEIDLNFLSKEALDNLIVEVITRQSSVYGEKEIAILAKKEQLLKKN